MSFQPDFSLQRLATIAYSISFLNQSDIQFYLFQDVRHCCKYMGYESVSHTDSCKYYLKTRELLKKLKEKNLPNSILNQIICVIESLLKRNRLWYHLVKEDFEIHHIHSDIVHWTCFGTIDTAKIISNEWSKWFNPNGKLIRLPYEDQNKTKEELAIKEHELRREKEWERRSYLPIARRKVSGHLSDTSDTSDDEDLPPYLFRSDQARFAKYYMACACILTSYIKSHCYEMLELCQMCSTDDLKSEEKIEYIVYSVFFFMDSTKLRLRKFKKFIEFYKDIYEKIFKNLSSFEKKKTANSHMFSRSVDEGNDVAAKYYWKLLSLQEKNKLIISMAVYCFCSQSYTMHDHIFIFLLVEMSEDQRKCFFNQKEIFEFNEKVRLATIFFDFPLWEELFFPTFEALKDHYSREDCYELLKEIAKKMMLKNISDNMTLNNERDKIGYDSGKTIYYRMFVTVFEEMRKKPLNKDNRLIPIYDANDDCSHDHHDPFLLQTLFQLFNISIFKLLMNFECEDNLRKQFLNPSRRSFFKKLAFENEFQFLNKFVEEVLKSDEEKDWFKKSFKYSEEFITKDKIENLDNLLDWQSNSNEERKKLKYSAIVQVDLMGVCGKLFVERNINLAKKAKKWAFSDDQDRQNYFVEYKGNNLAWLNRIWGWACEKKGYDKCEIQKAKAATLKFLNFFWGSDERATRFKEEKLININVVKNFVRNLKTYWREAFIYGGAFKAANYMLRVLIELLKFSLLPKDLSRLKKNISDNFEEWLLFLIEFNHFDYIDLFFNWVFNDRDKKEKVIKQYLLSESRFKFFDRVIKYIESYHRDQVLKKRFKKLFKNWIKFFVDKDEMNNYVEEIFWTCKSNAERFQDRYTNELKCELKFYFNIKK